MSSVLTESMSELNTDLSSSARPSPGMTSLVLLLGDLVAIALASGSALILASFLDQAPVIQGWHVLIIAVAVPLAFMLADLYPGAGVSPVDEMRSIILILSTFALTFLVAGLAQGLGITALLQLGVIYVATVLLVIEMRILLRELLARRPWWGVPAVVLGGGKTARLIIESLARKPNLNLKIIECLDDNPDIWGLDVAGVPVTGSIRSEISRVRRNGVNYAIVAMPGMAPNALSTLVDRLGRLFAKVVVTPNAFGMTSSGVGTRDSGAVVGLYVRGHLSLRRNLFLKRVVDLVLLAPLGLVAIPILTISAITIFVTSPGNPFYAQVREGYRGRRIRLWKLRTMHRNSEELLKEYLDTNPAAGEEWRTRFKLEKDPRIIPVVGSFFRRMSLDELPQLLNIAKGELSFVGPRPFPDYHLDSFTDDFRQLRASVPPGLTGYWQVTSRATADLAGQVELDSYYIANWSLWLDLYVMARTPWAVIVSKGAY